MLYDKRWDVEPEVKLEPWRQMLLDAADLLERDGWCQGAYQDDDGHHCALGALDAVFGSKTSFKAIDWSAYARVNERLQDAVGLQIVHWNDAKGRTAEEVISTLRKIAGA